MVTKLAKLARSPFGDRELTARPVALPEVFTGDGKQSWSDWVDHFKSVADVNNWGAETKKKWIRA